MTPGSQVATPCRQNKVVLGAVYKGNYVNPAVINVLTRKKVIIRSKKKEQKKKW